MPAFVDRNLGVDAVEAFASGDCSAQTLLADRSARVDELN
jgi:hypothetical protein